ncbi:hypothetical protein [Thiocapsa sp. N5-Cardenillas]|uniref:hypothetical protein n=1 Tax=Thiocapsa sp. N5-Cardenillas TaxID=3137397 RepID=UPI0035B3FB36
MKHVMAKLTVIVGIQILLNGCMPPGYHSPGEKVYSLPGPESYKAIDPSSSAVIADLDYAEANIGTKEGKTALERALAVIKYDQCVEPASAYMACNPRSGDPVFQVAGMSRHSYPNLGACLYVIQIPGSYTPILTLKYLAGQCTSSIAEIRTEAPSPKPQ